jgi:hypothetical protein
VTIVMAGRRCIGCLIKGRRGIEAFDRNEKRLGVFDCPIDAAAAVEGAAVAAEGGVS